MSLPWTRATKAIERRVVRRLQQFGFKGGPLSAKGRNRLAPEPVRGERGYRVHLGCGAIALDGFLNVESRWFPHVHYVTGATRLDFLADGDAELVYASHVLEHVSHVATLDVLREWIRPLASGGRLYVAVPDFDGIVDKYLGRTRDVASIVGPLMGEQDYPENTHLAVFNRASLEALFARAGLEDIRLFEPDEILPPDVWDNSRHELSLNLSGRKP